jgi:hypothetical protein
MRAEGFGTCFIACLSNEQIKFVAYSFVNDMDLIQTARTMSESEQDVALKMQRSLNTWEGAIHATGGAIVPSKGFGI